MSCVTERYTVPSNRISFNYTLHLVIVLLSLPLSLRFGRVAGCSLILNVCTLPASVRLLGCFQFALKLAGS